MKINSTISEAIGWYGTVAIVGAFALNNFGVLPTQSILYQILNITGSFGILYIASLKKDWQPAVLNAIWAVIAIIALVRMFM
ncbi:MAG: CBU_0592 family membrane protein [Candidatus Gracilibacteria bacterium]